MPKKSIVYSYLRFSDPKQAAGSSADRQLEHAAKWAAEHGMELDSSLSLRDEGLSAYHQRHIKQGALGVFLQAVEDGRIARGSVLVVEGLDRLSRAEPIQAQAQLAQIVNAGITVVTASDGREYNRERLRAQPMDLVYSLLIMIRAHEESDTKSKRVKAAIRRQCQGWIAGTWRGIIRNGKDPKWTKLGEDGRFELVPERVLAVRTMIEMFMQGHGATRATRIMAQQSLFFSNNGSPSVHFYRIIRNRALLGEKSLEVDGEVFRLEGYYPAILSFEEFADLQHAASQRGFRKGKGEIPSVITGLQITTCGYCSGAIVTQNVKVKSSGGNSGSASWTRRLSCSTYRTLAGCPTAGTCNAALIERAVMHYCSNEFNLTRLLEGDRGGGAASRASQLALARQQVADLELQIQRITDALISDEGAAPAAFMRRARELEEKLVRQQKVVEELEHQVVASASHATPAAAEAWATLVEGVEALDYDARMKARQLVADTFSGIVLFQRGVRPASNAWNQRKGLIGLALIAKHGSGRYLTIDRVTGELRDDEEIDASTIPSHGIPLPPGARESRGDIAT